MTLNLWRYGHLVLAFTSALFLIIASITGVILAFEPINQSLKDYDLVPLEKVTLAETVVALEEEYNEVFRLSITPDDYVIASVLTHEGATEELYVSPITGEKLGSVTPQTPLFAWATNLHRSLFLKKLGRFFVGLFSFLLCFIVVTGIFLLAQRQGGFLKWFSKVRERNFNQRYHVILGRYLLIPILIVASTGVYLSVEKFELLPEQTEQLDWSVIPDETISAINFFENTSLAEVRNLNFPFSEDELDYFEIALHDREVLVHQYTGEVLSEVFYPFSKILAVWSFEWHTGAVNMFWALILLIASASILFFIFSGFKMFLKRKKKKKAPLLLSHKDESEYVILVGSESGNTQEFATEFARALIENNKTVFLSTLNEYTHYASIEKLIIFTATYGDGDAPTNARNFESLFQNIFQPHAVSFAVLGFGSTDYPKFCQFAIQVDALLHQSESFTPMLPLTKIDDRSEEQIKEWVKDWEAATGLTMAAAHKSKVDKKGSLQSFEVLERTSLHVDDTFLLQLKPQKRVEFQSGDLFNVIPAGETKVRQYSIAKIHDTILLSIKKHAHGTASTFLSKLKPGDIIKGSIQVNEKFHLPNTSKVLLVANGTGIAPFLGMIQEQNKQQDITLYWGGRTQESFKMYQPYLERFKSQNKLANYQLAFSQEASKMYVQALLQKEPHKVIEVLSSGGCILICGSLQMQQGVIETLENIIENQLQQSLMAFEKKGQILMDCY